MVSLLGRQRPRRHLLAVVGTMGVNLLQLLVVVNAVDVGGGPWQALALVSSVHASVRNVGVVINLVLLERYLSERTHQALMLHDLVPKLLDLLPEFFCLSLEGTVLLN